MKDIKNKTNNPIYISVEIQQTVFLHEIFQYLKDLHYTDKQRK